ncbi:hypothetical protein J1N35_046032 [Gossypium stocksii]|uniref:Bifunctional inhibitor/plant lipid transfer protein/seed storage helical domain-containing protein n=1 Tax=Gossypium stocksii TaxID=47602 RepID=A0A9D3U5I9_9ROSI|nr:hypothetical protein J1N35_046032 [Gossypium stocksii]
MAKLALLVATFAVAFFLVNASIYRITDGDEENWQQHDRRPCQDQIWQQGYLPNCQWYLNEQAGRSQGGHGSRHLNSCCYELQNLRQDCRCQGLKQALGQQLKLQGVHWQSQEAGDMCEAAETALYRCRLDSRRCNMHS